MLGTICWPNEEWILKIKQFLLATGVSGGMDWPTSADESGNWAGPFSLWKKVFRRPPPVRKAANESAIKNCHELVILNDSTITYNWNQLNYDFGRSPMYRSPFWYSWTVPLSTEKFPEAVIMWLDLNFDRPFVGRTSIEPSTLFPPMKYQQRNSLHWRVFKRVSSGNHWAVSLRTP